MKSYRRLVYYYLFTDCYCIFFFNKIKVVHYSNLQIHCITALLRGGGQGACIFPRTKRKIILKSFFFLRYLWFFSPFLRYTCDIRPCSQLQILKSKLTKFPLFMTPYFFQRFTFLVLRFTFPESFIGFDRFQENGRQNI